MYKYNYSTVLSSNSPYLLSYILFYIITYTINSVLYICWLASHGFFANATVNWEGKNCDEKTERNLIIVRETVNEERESDYNRYGKKDR